MGARMLRATVLGGLAALVLARCIFVDIERVRVKAIAAPTQAARGLVRVTSADFPLTSRLQPPFALIARIDNQTGTEAPFSVAVDGARVCERRVAAGGARRIDCVVAETWNGTGDHEIAVQGPSAPWTLEYLELATHHGNTSGGHYLVVLPRASTRYLHPSIGWVIAAWLVVAAAAAVLPVPERMPRWTQVLYRVVAAIILAEFALSVASPWISDYRLVLSAGTFVLWIALLFAPRLWAAARAFERRASPYLGARPAARRALALAVVALAVAGSGATVWQLVLKGPWEQYLERWRVERGRQRLYNALQPVKLANCDFKRFGEANDGGYVLCANLLGSVKSAYSYGISGYDQWGCDVSRGLSVPVHQYDCFNLQRPACAGGQTVFHEECVGTRADTIDGRLFDSVENQVLKNGDAGKQLVVKMDVEGAEWDSLLQARDAVFERIDQLTIELHRIDDLDRYTQVVEKLKRFFYVANLHYNNFTCQEGIAPFPADVYEVLFVSKRLARPGGPGPGGAPPGVTAPNNPKWKDCQSLADLPPVRD
jgi:hypothetical protein